MPTIATILLATLAVSDFTRIKLHKVREREQLVKQAQIAAQNHWEGTRKSVVEDKIDKAFNHRDTGAAGTPVTALQSPAPLVQKAVSHGSVFSPAFNVTVRKQVGVVPNEPPSLFCKTLEHMRTAHGYNRIMILTAACDSSAFSCEEIIQLANHCWPYLQPYIWKEAAMLFAKARNKKGCISDPGNGKLVVDSFDNNWPQHNGLVYSLKQAFIDNDDLKPAKGVEPSPERLQTGFRTVEDMEKLLGDMEELQLIKSHWLWVAKDGGLYEPGSPRVEEFERWLKQIRAQGEQFSGPQLVALVNAIPKNPGTASAVSALLQYLEQYVTGVTCEEVKQIMRRMIFGDGSFLMGLDALRPNIVDGHNKVDIIAYIDLMYPLSPFMAGETFLRMVEMALQDVGVGLPPKNNPTFGLVKGNPVILVVDESTSMDAKFTLGDGTFTPRKFCHSQLETVLQGLPNGTYFNVIQYSSSAVKIFQKVVLVNKTNIDAAMDAMGTTWRGDYRPGRDPVQMLRNIRVFALKFKHRLKRSTNRNSMEALQLAYGTADLPSPKTDKGLHTLHDHGALVLTKGLPQIYFLTSGQPDGGSRQILDRIDVFDNGRNIPVNSIVFDMPADPVAKQFVKDLANKTGGFFRSIEQASLYTNKSMQEPTDG